ncbi:MAG: PAS domain S-box protein [Nitrospiraceae bacterium]|nr:PAS domain S-box protein [Nitrospiraceae bacterium]
MSADEAGKKLAPVFPIVAIGASAGGLNALECFAGALPGKFAFAVVFMQHLSTKHKSLLPELLRHRRPDIDIQEISDGLTILPGKIYLCPPGKEVRIKEDAFHISAPSAGHVHLPIDEFFTDLAEDAGGRVIAVIFSGAGTDGARGVRAIRDAGGSVFVQDPSKAEFPGMPISAINAGQADAVLAPDEIAREILKLHGAVTAGAEKDITPDQFDILSRLIHEKTGYNFSHYKKSVISRRLRRRMFLKGVSSVQAYLQILAEKDPEAAGLASDLMIGVTSFFRDRLAWKALRTEVIRKLAATEEDQPVRVWTPACSTGEEAYSIAMMLRHEFGLVDRRREIQVFATDVNVRALEGAREGKYPGSIVSGVPPEYMKKYFGCSEDGLSVIVNKEIRESVVFARQDLLKDPPFSRLDLIICRNLLIYLEPEAQEKCIAVFHYALKDGGYLFLGNAESAGRNSVLFKSLGHKKCRVYQKVVTKQAAMLSLAVPFPPEPARAVPLRTMGECQQSLTEFVQQALLEKCGPAAVAVNQHYDIVYNNGPTNIYLRQPRGAPTHNLLELLPDDLRNRTRGALYRAAKEGKPVSIGGSVQADNGKKKQAVFNISKIRDNLFLIIFSDKGRASKEAETVCLGPAAVDEGVVRQLESELAATRAGLQSHIEQQKSLNEELQSSNEELQAANEELETSREELQSLNEELVTVNFQLQSKIEEEEEINNDLNNFLSSTNIPTLFLDHRFRVKRFTPAMSRLLKLIPADVGRPIVDMSQKNLGPDLISDAQEVLDHLAPIKKEIAINGNWYIRAALPYRTLDNRIEGVVITYNDVSDVKKAQESMFMLSSLVQSAEDAIISKDLNGIIRSWNIGAENVFGYTAQEAIGRNISFLIPPSHTNEEPGIINRIAKGEHIGHFESVRMRKDGTVIPVLLTFSAIKDENGSVIGVSKIAHDITERKQVEEALRNSEGGLARAQAIAHLANWEVDLRTSMVTGSAELYRLFNLERGLPLDAYIEKFHPDDRSMVVEAINSAIKEGKPYHIDYRIIPSPGEIRFVHAEGQLNIDDNGCAAGFFGTVQDITERKQAEEAFRRSQKQNEFLADLIRNSSQPIGVGYPDGRLGLVNRAFEQLTGYTAEELMSMDWINTLTPPGWREMERKKLAELERTGRSVRYEKEYIRKSVIRLPIELLVHVVAGTEGKPQYYYAFLTDITERKLVEEALRDSEARYRSLFANMLDGLAYCQMLFNDEGLPVDFIYLTVNSSFERLTGLKDVSGKKVTEAMPGIKGSSPELFEIYGRVASTGKPERFETYLKSLDKWFSIAVYSPKMDHFIAIFNNITERKQAEEALQRRKEKIEILADSARRLLSAEEPEKIVQAIAERVMRYLKCQVFFNYFVEEGKSRMHLNAYYGVPDEVAKQIEHLDFGVAVCGCAAQDGRKMVAADIPNNPDKRTGLVSSFGVKSYACHPLMYQGKTIGTLSFGACNRTHFVQEELDLMEAVTDLVAAAMARKRIENDLKNAADEKETLIKELYHRTKNNMNVIANLMFLQMNKIKDPDMKQLFKEAQNRIQSMAIVHEMLYKTRELSRLDLKEYFGQLVKYILASYKKKNIKVQYEMDSVPVSLYLALPCGLILNELLSNSIRHAFPGNRSGDIAVQLKANGSEIRLSYSDNGVGLPDDFRMEDSNSLGMRILDGLIKNQLAGNWEIIRNRGVTVNITFDMALHNE